MPAIEMSLVLSEVLKERVRQEELWGQQNHPDGTGPSIPSLNRREQAQHDCDYAAEHGTLTYRHILEEEFYEALAESDPAELRTELIQLAAVAVAWAEKIDRDLKPAAVEHTPRSIESGFACSCGCWAGSTLDTFVNHTGAS